MFLLVLLIGLSEGRVFFWPIAHVHIKNELLNGINLELQCKSKDDDLGIHIVPAGNEYQFQFRPNYFGTTLFYCGLVWDGPVHTLDAYVYQRDNDLCIKDCYWLIYETQACLRYDNSTSLRCHKWT
ncbi:hypothetical protein TanjilG_02502 [Lupinus angustifolius]|uniref:S-protein homolog n=1 Tax=Lupinus angustifolius TaxID=3871 RepID=A0A1J7HWI1_LUPAN|nr:hypothetical protein TanjilG_02502 [Lupinus angustifolius]